MRVAGLFAGIGGIETGLGANGIEADLLVEKWDPARSVLRARFDTDLHSDVLELRSLPRSAKIVTAGFPCQDLSQAGPKAGIEGERSGLVSKVFELVAGHDPTWLVLENVQFMLQLDRGKAMAYLVGELNNLGYRWAYRLVDSRFSGVPQRRRRVLLVASPTEDPRTVLYADEAGEPCGDRYRDDAFGFYWTEGRGGLGWAQDAVPTLKGGSTIGIPSPPAVWVPQNEPGRKLLMLGVGDMEEIQDFERGWTEPAELAGHRPGVRFKLAGNAVTVGVANWLGQRLTKPGECVVDSTPLVEGGTWPNAAWGDRSDAWQAHVSEYPVHRPYRHLLDVFDHRTARALSHRAVTGFLSRLQRGGLRRPEQFDLDLAEHAELTSNI